ncbi:MAG: ribose 5-phosphate isomerase B [Bacteroidales bacterium]
METRNEIIPIGSDHGGFEMKQYLIDKLSDMGYQLKDFGTFTASSVDYPDFIHPVAGAVNNGEFRRAIILCGSGNGAQITANKYPKVRAALCWNTELARLARQHNNANILTLPGRFVSNELALEMAIAFLTTDFEGGRHQIRVDKISNTL